jgi:hypothetical protein
LSFWLETLVAAEGGLAQHKMLRVAVCCNAKIHLTQRRILIIRLRGPRLPNEALLIWKDGKT